MVRRLASLAAAFICMLVFSVVSLAAENASGFVIDYADIFDETQEKELYSLLIDAASETEMNLMIVTTKDIGSPKTDHHVMEYADDIYDEQCGINTDGVLLLINNDTNYDWISTSGSGINYLSDARIDSVLDDIYYYNKDERFYEGARAFVEGVTKYYRMGKANHQQEVGGKEVDFFDFWSSFGMFILIYSPIIIIATLIMHQAASSQYKLEKPKTRNYVLNNSLFMRESRDTFLGVITTRRYAPRSSGSSGNHHSGSSHRSSTHHSHSGGRHGGGGRHR